MPEMTRDEHSELMSDADTAPDSGNTVAEFWKAYERLAAERGFTAEEIAKAIEQFNN